MITHGNAFGLQASQELSPSTQSSEERFSMLTTRWLGMSLKVFLRQMDAVLAFAYERVL